MRAHPFARMTLALRLAGLILLLPQASLNAQPSPPRIWNEVLLEAIRNDFARPTVHARNLFHLSGALYDAWAAFDAEADTYLLGKTLHGFDCPFEGVPVPANIDEARTEAAYYAAYRLIRHRFRNAPDAEPTFALADSVLRAGGYSPVIFSTDYTGGSAAALGNYIARCYIDYGLQDGANEADGYTNRDYAPVNPPLVLATRNPTGLTDPNRWQPLTLEVFIDQSGNVIPRATPEFLSPEWGQVNPFALMPTDRTDFQRGGFPYPVYFDPGAPPRIAPDGGDAYLWNFALVTAWSAHLDPTDGVLWDISPASIGNLAGWPDAPESYPDFFDLANGGDGSPGHPLNPVTGLPYTPQIVPRGDYTRVLAEFWADGPDSETPPGHWYTILNKVHDHPAFQRRFRGAGPMIEAFEWDAKAYFALGGALHDAAIAAWGIKGWYDYIRPISAIRSMAERGQSSDPALPRFTPDGILLIDGLIESVLPGDSLAGPNGEQIGAIKLFAWRGHDRIVDPATDRAGAGWILASDWWPYQRPSFVTPPFAGFISGHSTFSRAAAELLTLLTGDPYFPGGLGEFHAPAGEFLVFEDGPSVDVTLQWATYRDASDQTSLSRIWGGIHPPVDDIPGRRIGAAIGVQAFALAERYFSGQTQTSIALTTGSPSPIEVYPNPASRNSSVTITLPDRSTRDSIRLLNGLGQIVRETLPDENKVGRLDLAGLAAGVYYIRVAGPGGVTTHLLVIL